MDGTDAVDPVGPDGGSFRAKGSLSLVVFGLVVVVAVGVFIVVVTFSRHPWFLLACFAWIWFGVWWTCFALSYEAVLLANGDIHVRSLCRRRVVHAANVTRIRTSYGEGGTAIVVFENDGASVRLPGGGGVYELARRIKQANPEAELQI